MTKINWKSWDKIKKWAKKDNEEIFNQIFNIYDLNLTTSYGDLKTAFEETNFKIRNPVSFCEVVDVDGQEEILCRRTCRRLTSKRDVMCRSYP